MIGYRGGLRVGTGGALPPVDLTGYPPITKMSTVPVQNLSRPAYLNYVIDTTYGYPMKIWCISDPSVFGDTTTGHGYSKQQYWSSDQALLKLNNSYILDGNTYQYIRSLNIASVSQFSNLKPDTVFNFGASKVVEINARTGVTGATILNFADSGITLSSTSMQVGNGEGRTDNNDKYVMVHVFIGGVEHFALCDLQLGTVVSMRNKAQVSPDHDVDWTGVSGLGNYIVVNRAGTGGGKDVYTRDWVYLSTAPRWTHVDFCLDLTGKEVIATSVNPQMWDLQTAVNTDFISQSDMEGYFTAMGGHLSGCAFNKPGWTYNSIMSPESPNAECYAIKMDTSGDVMRFCPTRKTGDSYTNEPQASVDRFGKRMLFTSNWGGVTRAYVVEAA